MSDIYVEVSALLMDVECAMRNLQLWNRDRPSLEALASDQPFCIDTLDFSEWLQFVFIERMQILIDQRMPLPRKSAVAPMAEEYFRGNECSGESLIVPLLQLDGLLSRD